MYRSAHQSKKFIFKRRNKIILIMSIGIITFVVGIYILSVLSYVQALSIKLVNISGVDNDDEQIIIRSKVLETIGGSYLGIFSRANILIYPHNAVVSKIKNTFPYIEHIDIERDGAQSLVVIIKEKVPTTLVCTTLPDFVGSDLSLNDPGSCYFSDPTGYLFKKAPSFSGNIYRRYYTPDIITTASSSDFVVGKMATSTNEFVKLEKIYSTLSANDISVNAILMKSDYEYELYAHNPVVNGLSASTTSTVVIYFNTYGSVDDQISNLISFWKHTIQSARTSKRAPEFSYIDIRYSPNVFFRENK